MRRALHTAAGRLNSAVRNQAEDAVDTESPIASENNSEVLTILRSLQQQVSALQARQASQDQVTPQAQVEASPGDNGSSTSTPRSTKRRLPRDLVVSQY